MTPSEGIAEQDTTATCSEMIRVPAGPFLMGTSSQQLDWLASSTDWAQGWRDNGYFDREQPQHVVTIPDSSLFGLWHIGPFFLGAPIWAVIAIMLVPFLSGLGWGWQVQRDKTVMWAMLQHSLIWVVGLQFTLPG